MNDSNYEIITDILKELHQEYNDIQQKIDDVKANQSNFQEELNQYYSEQNRLRSKIDKLEKVVHDEQELNLSILNIQEEDRQRIARDLHDTSLQNLTYLIHKIELSSMFIDEDVLKAKLELTVVNKNLKFIIDEIRNTIFDLRPMSFDDLGLKSAFEELIQKINENRQYQIDMSIEEVSCENNVILVTIYRVVQECLNNIKKHSDATQIIFYCKQVDSHCFIDIKDNGKGFTKEEIESKKNKHFGISVIKERVNLLGGKISIQSKKKKGTHVHIDIPLI